MATVIDIEPTKAALLKAIQDSGIIGIPDPLTEDMIGATFASVDRRNHWNSHIVTIQDWGIYGYTDGPVT
jgi:hypothetical protein